MNDALLDLFQAAWSSRRRAAFAECCAPDVHYEDPVSRGPCEGLDELGEHASRLWTLLPDTFVERSGERLGDGRYVAAPVRISGTHLGELPRLPPTRRRIALQAVLFCELDAPRERLWRVRAFFDPYDAGVQLGVLPARGTMAERAMLAFRGFGLRG